MRIKNFEAYANAEDFFHGPEKEKPNDFYYRGYLISPQWHYFYPKTKIYNGYNDFNIFPDGDSERGTYLRHATIKDVEEYIDELIDEEN